MVTRTEQRTARPRKEKGPPEAGGFARRGMSHHDLRATRGVLGQEAGEILHVPPHCAAVRAGPAYHGGAIGSAEINRTLRAKTRGSRRGSPARQNVDAPEGPLIG